MSYINQTSTVLNVLAYSNIENKLEVIDQSLEKIGVPFLLTLFDTNTCEIYHRIWRTTCPV